MKHAATNNTEGMSRNIRAKSEEEANNILNTANLSRGKQKWYSNFIIRGKEGVVVGRHTSVCAASVCIEGSPCITVRPDHHPLSMTIHPPHTPAGAAGQLRPRTGAPAAAAVPCVGQAAKPIEQPTDLQPVAHQTALQPGSHGTHSATLPKNRQPGHPFCVGPRPAPLPTPPAYSAKEAAPKAWAAPECMYIAKHTSCKHHHDMYGP